MSWFHPLKETETDSAHIQVHDFNLLPVEKYFRSCLFNMLTSAQPVPGLVMEGATRTTRRALIQMWEVSVH